MVSTTGGRALLDCLQLEDVDIIDPAAFWAVAEVDLVIGTW